MQATPTGFLCPPFFRADARPLLLSPFFQGGRPPSFGGQGVSSSRPLYSCIFSPIPVNWFHEQRYPPPHSHCPGTRRRLRSRGSPPVGDSLVTAPDGRKRLTARPDLAKSSENLILAFAFPILTQLLRTLNPEE